MSTQLSVRSFSIFALALSILVGGIATPLESEAQSIRRSACSGRGAGAMGRNMGDRNAKRLINNAWARLGQSCDQVDRLATIVAETPFAQSSLGGVMGACFFQGYVEGLWDELDLIYERCGNKCFSAGVDIGNISAQGYCAASIAVNGLLDPGFIEQPPLPFCGQNLVFGCKSEYIGVATYDIPACSKYTKGRFAETFENSVRQDCFVPTDVPIFDDGLI